MTISVPCGFDGQRLPIGLQIGGLPGGEAAVLKVAHAYEQVPVVLLENDTSICRYGGGPFSLWPYGIPQKGPRIGDLSNRRYRRR